MPEAEGNFDITLLLKNPANKHYNGIGGERCPRIDYRQRQNHRDVPITKDVLRGLACGSRWRVALHPSEMTACTGRILISVSMDLALDASVFSALHRAS